MVDRKSPEGSGDDAVIARIAPGVRSVAAADWDALAGDDNPFLSHAFLSLLEESGSVGPGTGWQAAPILLGGEGAPEGVVPAYLKGHSQGEYVFDHSWAEAWHHAGRDYYPKLQVAVPFTPVTGRRLLSRDDDGRRALIAALEAVTIQNGLSSAHATFLMEDEVALFRDAGWLIRQDVQFHWYNRGFADFDGFLAALSSRKRKAIRKEREAANAAVDVVMLTGQAIREDHWDLVWACYQDTGARKWGRPYLTREAFRLLGELMADRVLLAVAYEKGGEKGGGAPIAMALNLIGADALYGRYWGALAEVPCLHFELCYYRAIDFAIAHGLARVEAGAQGPHKLARGYEPSTTWSAHYIPDAGFRAAVAEFLKRETRAVEQESEWLGERLPFRKDG